MSDDAFTDADVRKAMFIPCETQEELHTWILAYLGLDIPDCCVDAESTSNPMAVIWEIYQEARLGLRPDFSRLLAFGPRDGFKTLLSAILEVLSILHLERSVAHMAAVEFQASKAQGYVKDFFEQKFLTDYVTVRNERRIEFAHYENQSVGEHLTEAQYTELPVNKEQNTKKKNYIQIIVCSTKGVQGEHSNLLVLDEIDVIDNPKAYKAAKLIPTPFQGKNPITLLISTRQTAFGLVQKEIDDAPNTGLQVRHWNIIDCTSRCPETRHRPEEPRVTLYRSDEELRHLDVDGYKMLSPEIQSKFTRHERAYAGCASCSLFAMCKGKLVNQTSNSPLLKPIPHVINLFRDTDLDDAQAWLMSRKPGSAGLVYPRFNSDIHLLTAAEMATIITGSPQPPTTTKSELVAIMMANGLGFYTGLDWGFTHSFALVSLAVQGLNAFVFDAMSQVGLDPEEKLVAAERVNLWGPTIFADPEAPDQIKLFKKKGFRMKEWKKGAGSVKMGIDVVRMKLRPAIGKPQLFFLRGDSGTEHVAACVSKFHFKLDAAGDVTGIPAEEFKDENDALRYPILNLFTPRGRVSTGTDAPEAQAAPTAEPTVGNYLQHFIAQNLGTGGNPGADPATKKGGRAGLIWDFD